ncbi:hem-containing dehydratase protein [Aspergillus unguis]
MYTIKRPPSGTFVYSLFGVQQPTSPISDKTKSQIKSLDCLLNSTDSHIDRVTQDGILLPGSGKTHIWLATWASPVQFEQRWGSHPVVDFWASLHDDAGVWREIIHVPFSRTQYKATQDWRAGQGVYFPHVPATKNGYWGWIRDSIEELSRENRMDTPVVEALVPQRPGVVDLSEEKVRGRVLMDTFPENLCFNLERQDLSRMVEGEKSVWFDQFDRAACKWMDDLTAAAPEAGILTSRMCYDESKGTYKEDESEFHKHTRKVELFFFKDLKSMERVGRSNKGHVQLRNNILQTYGPGGQMSECGKLALWVETSVLKASEIVAEYIGCVPGTGFLAYRNHEAFQSINRP